MTICERLFDILDNTPGLTAYGLCKALGVRTSTTTSWKKRNTDPPASLLCGICEYLGCSLHFLLTGEEAQETKNEPAPEISGNGRKMLDYFEILDEGDQREVIGYVRRMVEEAAKKDRQNAAQSAGAKAV